MRGSRPPGFDAAAYAAAHPDIEAVLGQDPDKLYRHWTEWGFLENRTPFGLAPYAGRRFGRGFWGRRSAVTLYGLFDQPSGLGTAARAYRAALEAAGVEVTCVAVTGRDLRFETSPDVRPRSRLGGLWQAQPEPAWRTKVNLFVLNADMVHRFFLDGRLGLLDDSYNIAVWFWELAAWKPVWTTAFAAFDEIWTASEFCRAAIGAVSPVPVVTVPMPVLCANGSGERLTRQALGLPTDAFLFGCMFDVGSVVARKNPLAAVDAFVAAFGDRTDVALVLKYLGTEHYPESMAPVLAAAGGRANIRSIDRSYDARELASFRAALDCLVSPHRSEGFGLNIAEALSMGRPVIATDYSGSVDVLDESVGVPVPFRFAEVGPEAGPYPPGALWADPDLGALTDAMRRVVEDRAASRARAERGQARIAAAFAPEASAPALLARLEPVFRRTRRDGPPPSWGRSREAVSRWTGDPDPRIGLVVPVEALGPGRLRALVDEVLAQADGRWDLLLQAGPGRVPPALAAVLDDIRGSDPRLKVGVAPAVRARGSLEAVRSEPAPSLPLEVRPSAGGTAEPKRSEGPGWGWFRRWFRILGGETPIPSPQGGGERAGAEERAEAMALAVPAPRIGDVLAMSIAPVVAVFAGEAQLGPAALAALVSAMQDDSAADVAALDRAGHLVAASPNDLAGVFLAGGIVAVRRARLLAGADLSQPYSFAALVAAVSGVANQETFPPFSG